jgi:hypothetical protein
MPNRNDPRGFGGERGRPETGERETGERETGQRDTGQRDTADRRAIDRGGPRARADDARLASDLRRFERRRGLRRADYGHDENYRPGYHEGGTRFGFFGVSQGDYRQALDDQEFDPDYLHWRGQQLQRHDRDYADWCRHQSEQYDEEYRRFRAERRDDFHQRFQDWRAQREAAAIPPPNPDDKL